MRGHPAEECVWIGDLSGFQVTEINECQATLYHRCGWVTSVLPYLGNLVEAARSHTDCRPYQPHPLAQVLADARAAMRTDEDTG